MQKIVVIGSLNMDNVIEVNSMPAVGETVHCIGFFSNPGGKGANQAYAAANLGSSVSMIGAIGDDVEGLEILNNLKLVNVDTSGIEVISNTKTGNAFVTIDRNSNNSIIVLPGANDCLDSNIIEKHRELILEADIIILQLEIPIQTVSYVLKLAKSLNKFVILDPAPASNKLSKELYKYIDIIKPNESELSSLSGMKINSKDDLISAARLLVNYGVSTVIVTLGGKGSVIVTNDYTEMISSRKVEAIDSTGAGDCFIGSLAMSLSNGENLRKSVYLANVAASISVTKKGAQSSMPTKIELLEIVNELDNTHYFL